MISDDDDLNVEVENEPVNVEPEPEPEPEPAPTPAPAPKGAKMVKVETTGSFQLIDPITNRVYSHDDAQEVPETPFVTQCLADGRMKEV